MKKLIAFLLALAMVVGLVACGTTPSTDETSGNDQTVNAVSGESKPQTEKSETPSAPLEIEWWSNFGEAHAVYLQQIIDAFNESQDNWHLTYVYQGGAGDLLAKVQATNLEDLPALFSGPVENIGLYATADFCAPLQPYIDADEEGWPELESTWEAIRVAYQDIEGNQIGYPIGYSYGGLYYNVDMFKEAGIDPDSIQCWEDLYETCKILVEGGYATYGMGFNAGGYFFNAALGREGLQLYNNNNGLDGERITECLFTDDDTVYNAIYTILDNYQKMHAEGLVMPYGTNVQGEVIPAFGAGDCGMFISVVSHTTKVLEAVNGSFEVGFTTLPSATENGMRTGHPAGGTGTWIGNNGNADAMQGAYEFIKFASQGEYAALWSTITGYLAPNQQAYDDPQYQDYLTNVFPGIATLYEKLEAGDDSATNPYIPISSEMNNAVHLAVSTVCADPNADIDAAIKTAEDTIQEAIDLYNMANP